MIMNPLVLRMLAAQLMKSVYYVLFRRGKMAERYKKRKRGAGPVSIILLMIAMVFLVYGTVVIMHLGTSNWFNFIWFIGAGVLIVLSFLFSRDLGMPLVLRIFLGLIILVCVSNFGIFTYHMINAMNSQTEYDAKWVIVLGAKVNGTEPSREFRERISKAAEYVRLADADDGLNKKEWPKVIATGGQGDDEGAAEGEVCAKVIKTFGISSDRILIDNQSTTTLENFGYAKALIETSGGYSTDKVVIVTSGFHLYRAMQLAKKEGFNNVTCCGSTGLISLLPHYIAREYAAYIKEVSLGHIEGNPLPFEINQ